MLPPKFFWRYLRNLSYCIFEYVAKNNIQCTVFFLTTEIPVYTSYLGEHFFGYVHFVFCKVFVVTLFLWCPLDLVCILRKKKIGIKEKKDKIYSSKTHFWFWTCHDKINALRSSSNVSFTHYFKTALLNDRWVPEKPKLS